MTSEVGARRAARDHNRAMVDITTRPLVGSLLREWRQRRRLSQLDLALEAGVSARHVSFVETGRSRPSAEMVLHLAEQLGVPLRERNGLLLAAATRPPTLTTTSAPPSWVRSATLCTSCSTPTSRSRRSSSTATGGWWLPTTRSRC